jgi:16S rRNA (guanine527-N7)-methyltransferase
MTNVPEPSSPARPHNRGALEADRARRPPHEDPGQREPALEAAEAAPPLPTAMAVSAVADAQPSTTPVQPAGAPTEPPAAAHALFGDRLNAARRYAALLADTGVAYGLIGPKEGDRVWERHLLNCAALSELIEPDARVLDLGSGAGLPGIPLALVRPDLEVVLLESLARRVDWLREVLDDLDLPLVVVRGRAEDAAIRRQWGGADVVTARAVAPLARLAGWALPLLRPGGRLLAMKGESAHDEVIRDRAAVRGFGGSTPRVVQCGRTYVEPPTTVVIVERSGRPANLRRARRSGGRQR